MIWRGWMEHPVSKIYHTLIPAFPLHQRWRGYHSQHVCLQSAPARLLDGTMVVFVDLDNGDDDELRNTRDHKHVLNGNQLQQLRLDGRQSMPAVTPQDGRRALISNRNGFSAALSCYPYVFRAMTRYAA
jgi:hypothetical protein